MVVLRRYLVLVVFLVCASLEAFRLPWSLELVGLDILVQLLRESAVMGSGDDELYEEFKYVFLRLLHEHEDISEPSMVARTFNDI